MADEVAEPFAGLIAGIFEFVAIVVGKAFVGVYASLNAPTWSILLFIATIVILLILDFLSYLSGIGSTLGFAAGAWLVGDQSIAVVAIIVYAAIQATKAYFGSD